MALEIRTAAELTDPELEARWTTRRAARETDVLQQVLRAFVARAGPVEVEQIVAAFADGPPDGIRADLARLDADDLIQIRDGLVEVAPRSHIAYPHSQVAGRQPQLRWRDFSAQISHTQPSGSLVRVLIALAARRRFPGGGPKYPRIGAFPPGRLGLWILALCLDGRYGRSVSAP